MFRIRKLKKSAMIIKRIVNQAVKMSKKIASQSARIQNLPAIKKLSQPAIKRLNQYVK